MSYIDILFVGTDPGRFIEIEDEHGRSIKIGKWIKRPDGLWALRIQVPPLEGDE